MIGGLELGQELRCQSGSDFGDGGDVLAGATQGVFVQRVFGRGLNIFLNRLLNILATSL